CLQLRNMSVKKVFTYYSKCPTIASYYGNQAATLMMLCWYKEAFGEIQNRPTLLSPVAGSTATLRHIVNERTREE
uniref:Uncharacterized protein n=1 Tax=Amphiprion ocellaris TaxID=80972 RepID=A0AAQ5XNL3_AMPOC